MEVHDGSTYSHPGHDDNKMFEEGVYIDKGTGKIYRVKDGKFYPPPGESLDCLDETCQSCQDFSEFFPMTLADCAITESQSAQCKSFQRAFDCCNNPSSREVDPRLVLPNPNGDLVCMTDDFTASAKQKHCETKCSVVDREGAASTDDDCYSDCLSIDFNRGQWDLLDSICTYAYSDACVRLGNAPQPPKSPGRDGWQPQPFPIPYGLRRYMMLPISDLDFTGIQP